MGQTRSDAVGADVGRLIAIKRAIGQGLSKLGMLASVTQVELNTSCLSAVIR
jgi:hypothetical protein